MNEVERLKSEGRFYHAGALAFILGCDNNYGCHYGLRSTREQARFEFRCGFADVELDYRLEGSQS